jgi:hypothetical protein
MLNIVSVCLPFLLKLARKSAHSTNGNAKKPILLHSKLIRENTKDALSGFDMGGQRRRLFPMIINFEVLSGWSSPKQKEPPLL